MSQGRDRLRGRLFTNADKRKPSQPDMRGDGFIGGKPYAITAWEREDQLVLSLAPPREGTNKYPAEEFHGALDSAPAGAEDDLRWTGDIESEEATYSVRAYEQQGKSGAYLKLELSLAPAEA